MLQTSLKMARYNVRECWMVDELRREREASSLDIEELTNFLSGNEALTERRREICELALHVMRCPSN